MSVAGAVRIHPTAVISPDAELGADVEVGAYTVVGEGVSIGDCSVVGPFCFLGERKADRYEGTRDALPLRFGSGTVIRSHSVFYEGSEFGPELETGHHVTVREETCAGRSLRLGTLSDIQGGCTIGDYVRLHSNVHVGQHSRLADFVWIFPYVVLTNDPHPPSEVQMGVIIDEYAVIATMSVLLPGVHVGSNALVAAHSLVKSDVDALTIVGGVPAHSMGSIDRIRNRETGEAVYPWPEHFNRGMPWAESGFGEWLRLAESETPE